MSGVVDKRREDLIIPYVHTPDDKAPSSSVMTQSMPMAAMFMKSKLLAWCGLFSSIQTYLNEPEQPSADASPAWMSMATALLSICVTYLDFVFSRPAPPIQGSKAVPSAS